VESRTTPRDGGFSLIELLLVIAIIAIVAAIALPGLMRARLAANESSAIASLRTIGSAQATFASSCGGGGFAQSLEDLSEPPTGTDLPFVPADMAAGEKSGYTFVMVEGLGEPVAEAEVTCNGASAGTRSSFLATANPITDGQSGVRGFGIDKSNTVRWTAAPEGISDEASYASALTLQ
jgi:prepilin-type N-terminal cleavage/methylation domain-containing protein